MISETIKKKLEECPLKVQNGIEKIKSLIFDNTKIDQLYIYGGYLRGLWNDEPYRDVDVFTFNKPDWITLKNKIKTMDDYGYSFDLMDLNVSKQIWKICSCVIYSFTIENMYYSSVDNCIYHSVNAFHHYSEKLLIIDVPMNILKFNVHAVYRMSKYINRGYVIPLSELNKILASQNTLYNKINYLDQKIAKLGIIKDTMITKS